MSKKHAGYVFIPVKPGTRAALTQLKAYGDTYDTVIRGLLDKSWEQFLDDYAAQNIDDTRDENG